MAAIRGMWCDQGALKAGGGRAHGGRVRGRYGRSISKGHGACGWSIHGSSACGRRNFDSDGGDRAEDRVLIGAANIFIGEDVS